jgi:hypothetical protein
VGTASVGHAPFGARRRISIGGQRVFTKFAVRLAHRPRHGGKQDFVITRDGAQGC